MMATPERAPWRVLIVDDEENLNWSLVTSLRKDGYIADGARTGEEALMRLQAAAYDCVVSDIKMPGMDGFELLQWLRRHQPAARVVMITSFGSPSARQDALREGAVAFFEKPFDLRALKDQLRRMSEAPAPEEKSAPAAPMEAVYDLLDVAQVISLARRDVALDVRGGGATGTLRFAQGELLWAEAGALRGDEAFLALCVPRGGHAQVAPWNGQTERNITQPLARLIYTALGRREKRTSAPADLPAEPSADHLSAVPPLPSAGPNDDNETDELPAAATATPNAVFDVAPLPEPGEAIMAGAATTLSTVDEGTPPIDRIAPADEPATSNRADAAFPAAPAPPPPRAPSPLGAEAQPDEITAALETLANALPTPCGVAWISIEAGLLWQRWRGQMELPREALAPLYMAVRAAGQASSLGELGALDELRIVAADRHLILRRGPRGGTLLLSLAPDADAGAVATALVLAGLAG